MNSYKIGERVEYYIQRGIRKYHRVGFIKSVRRILFFTFYFVCVADRSREIDIVRPKQIFGILEKKDNQ